MAAPVCGLRAVLALRWAVLKVPNPTKVIAWPFFRDLVIPSMNESTAAAAFTLLSPVSSATLEINSFVHASLPEQEAEDICAA